VSIHHHQNAAEELRGPGYVDGLTSPGDLVQRKVDVIYPIGTAALRAARDATGTIPIIAINLEIDPVAAGYARTVAHPGGTSRERFSISRR